MKKNIKNIVLKSTALLIIAVMGLLLFNQSTNLHTHQTSDNKQITHAHPYEKTGNTAPANNHHHSDKELLALDFFKLLFSISIVVFALFCIAFSANAFAFHKSFVTKTLINANLGRAPPSFAL